MPKYWNDCLSELHSLLHIFADNFFWYLNVFPSNTLLQSSPKQPTYSYSKTTKTMSLEHWTSLTLLTPLLIAVPGEWTLLYVYDGGIDLESSFIMFSYWLLELFWSFGLLFLLFRFISNTFLSINIYTNTTQSFSHSWLVTLFVTRLTRWDSFVLVDH